MENSTNGQLRFYAGLDPQMSRFPQRVLEFTMVKAVLLKISVFKLKEVSLQSEANINRLKYGERVLPRVAL